MDCAQTSSDATAGSDESDATGREWRWQRRGQTESHNNTTRTSIYPGGGVFQLLLCATRREGQWGRRIRRRKGSITSLPSATERVHQWLTGHPPAAAVQILNISLTHHSVPWTQRSWTTCAESKIQKGEEEKGKQSSTIRFETESARTDRHLQQQENINNNDNNNDNNVLRRHCGRLGDTDRQ